MELDLVAKVMHKLSTAKAAGHLRKLTPLIPIRRNVTRCSSALDMTDRFLKIRTHARTVMLQTEDPGILPTAAQVKRIETLPKNELSIFQSVSLALQKEGTTVPDVRAIFGDVIAEIPDTAHHLSLTTAIVKHAPFENALVKIQLTAAELKAAQNLIVIDESQKIDVDAKTGLGFAARVLKRRRLAEQQEHRFSGTVFLEPTSNSVEQRFSTAKWLFSDKRSVCCLKRWNSYCSCVQTETCGV